MKGPALSLFLSTVAGQTRVLLLVTFVLGGYVILGLLDDVGAQTSINGARVAMSDWLDAYNISAVINLRLAELSTTRSSSGDQSCLP